MSEGRIAYKEYFKETLKDPESLVIHSEEVIKESDANATFVLNIGAKNSFGGMVRSTYTIETLGRRVLDVKEYDIRTIPKETMTFKYKEKNINTDTPITNKNFAGKKFKLTDDILAASDEQFLTYVIDLNKDNDAKYFNIYINKGRAIIINAGEEFTINDCFIYYNNAKEKNENLFHITYKGKCYVIEQSAIF